jgi:hypothetical protein
MTTAQESFDQFRIQWDAHIRVVELVDSIISLYEEKTNITLSPGARQILFIPFIEHSRMDGIINEMQINETISEVFSSLETSPDNRDEKLEGRIRSALSVIRAFWKRFCKIPPICS